MGETLADEVKPPPKSAFAESECATREDLVKMCFSVSPAPSAVASSASSNSSGSGSSSGSNASRVPPPPQNVHVSPTSEGAADGSLVLPPSLSPHNFKRSNSSRQGRDNQRWETHSETGGLIRLTTGSVPITKDGSIIFVSAAKKREWILPKGGWELDETLEQGAMRETHEEAGVLGTLGPRLKDVLYETRKQHKKRIDSQNTENNQGNTVSSGEEETRFAVSLENAAEEPSLPPSTGETTFDKNQASFCRMALFPLYVSEVLDDWPESGRARKVFGLDEALEMTNRSEIKLVLEEIKERGLNHPTAAMLGAMAASSVPCNGNSS